VSAMRLVLGFAALVALGAAASLAGSEYGLRLLNLAVIAAVSVVGLNFAFGYAGLITLGQSAFAGLGAYSLAILTTRLGWSPWLAAPVGIALTALAAAAVGLPLLRLKGHYLALATLGLNVSVGIVAANWIEVTGGTNGIAGIPALTLFGRPLTGERAFLWFGLSVLAVLSLGASLLHRSRYGRAMMAVRDDETAALMTGLDVTGIKVAAFTLSGAYAAVAGCLFALHVQFISPDDFGYAHSITSLSMLIVGGEGSITGAILGAVLLTFLPEWLRFLGQGYLAFFGLMMLAILIFLPRGLMGLVETWQIRRRGTAEARPATRAARPAVRS